MRGRGDVVPVSGKNCSAKNKRAGFSGRKKDDDECSKGWTGAVRFVFFLDNVPSLIANVNTSVIRFDQIL